MVVNLKWGYALSDRPSSFFISFMICILLYSLHVGDEAIKKLFKKDWSCDLTPYIWKFRMEDIDRIYSVAFTFVLLSIKSLIVTLTS